MKVKSILLLASMLALLGSSKAQFRKLITEFPPSKNPVVDIYVIPQTNEVIKFTSEDLPFSKLKDGPFAENDLHQFFQTVVFPSGKYTRLKDNENINDIKGNSIVTKQDQLIDETSLIRRYDITTEEVQLTGQFESTYESTAYMLKNGNVLISNETENFGSTFLLLDKNLNIISTIKPLEHDFFTAIYTETNGEIKFIIKKNAEKGVILFSVNSSTGILTGKTEIETLDIYPQLLKPAGKNLILFGSGQLVCLSHQGEVVWNQKTNLPTLDFIVFNNNKNILAITNDGAVCLSANTGKSLWMKPLSTLYKLPSIEKPLELPNIMLRVIALSASSDNNSIIMVLGQTNEGEMLTHYPKFNNKLVLLDATGDTQLEDQLDQKSYIVKLHSNDKSISILTNQKSVEYEKE